MNQNTLDFFPKFSPLNEDFASENFERIKECTLANKSAEVLKKSDAPDHISITWQFGAFMNLDKQ